MLKGVRESVLFYLNKKLGSVVNVQRDMVEKRIERVRERERSVLYKNTSSSSVGGGIGGWGRVDGEWKGDNTGNTGGGVVKMDEKEVKEIEKQLTPEQLQLFEEENDSLVRYFEDVVGKVQYDYPYPFSLSIDLSVGVWLTVDCGMCVGTQKNPSSRSPLSSKPSCRIYLPKRNISRSW